MTRHLNVALRMTLVTAVLLGLIYPLAITGIAQVVFPGAADGSLVKVDGRVVGSSLIAQGFTGAGYFHPRPSAAGDGYDAMASSFSNLGPTNQTLIDRVTDRRADGDRRQPGPEDGNSPRGHGHHIGQRARPRHHRRERAGAGAACGASPVDEHRGRPQAGRRGHDGDGPSGSSVSRA